MRHKDFETESASSTLSTASIRAIIDRLKLERNRDSTRKNYHTVWKVFSKFFIQLDMRPVLWEDRIVLFAGYLIDKGRKASTVKSYISAIKSVLKEGDIEISEDRFLINSLIRACHYKRDRVHIKLPIRRYLLNALLINLDKYYLRTTQPQPYLCKLFKAVFVAAYYGLLRVGEVAKGEHPVLAKDVHIGTNKDKILFILRSSKTHCEGDKPQTENFK